MQLSASSKRNVQSNLIVIFVTFIALDMWGPQFSNIESINLSETIFILMMAFIVGLSLKLNEVFKQNKIRTSGLTVIERTRYWQLNKRKIIVKHLMLFGFVLALLVDSYVDVQRLNSENVHQTVSLLSNLLVTLIVFFSMFGLIFIEHINQKLWLITNSNNDTQQIAKGRIESSVQGELSPN